MEYTTTAKTMTDKRKMLVLCYHQLKLDPYLNEVCVYCQIKIFFSICVPYYISKQLKFKVFVKLFIKNT